LTKRVSEQPIIFTDLMIHAILKGVKTQFRQVVKPFVPDEWRVYGKYQIKDNRIYWTNNLYQKEKLRTIYRICTAGRPKCRLWVCETFAILVPNDSMAWLPRVIYGGGYHRKGYTRWHPPRLMRRGDSRIILEITKVRAEKLQDVSEEDAQAEGVPKDKKDGLYRSAFRSLWNELDAAHEGTWEDNPWVWVIEFKRVS
jgi:hypothetical protein